MFDSVRSIAPPRNVAPDDDLDRVEQAFSCRLPADYRAFMTLLGPGNLNGYLDILSPDRVIDETVEMRAIYKEESRGSPYDLFFFESFENATEFFQPTDIERFICIASSGIGDTHYILPDEPPRYFEVPRDSFEVAIAGTTIEEWLRYLDPRTRYQAQARRIVEDGVVQENDGRPDGTIYIHVFTPEGYRAPEPDPRLWVDHEIVWGHSDDPRAARHLSQGYTRQPETGLALLHDDMARYPLIALLDSIAQHDPTTRFEMIAHDTPEATLTVPQYEATLRAARGQYGLTLYVHVPQEHATSALAWLVQEIRAVRAEAPPRLLALVSV